MTVLSHLTRHPNARPSTVVYLIVKNRTTAQLKAEVAAFAHLPDLLASHLAEILPEMCREDRARIEETW